MAEQDILVATANALLFVGEQRFAIRKGITTVRAGHSILAGREHLFEPLTVDFDTEPSAAPQKAAGAPTAVTAPDPKAVRAWAAENGIEASPKGKLPQDLIDQYAAAQGA